MKMTISANIKRLRTAKSITQEELSEAMNVTCAAVSKWERGETYPDITLLQPLAYYFGVSLDELMGYDQERIQAEIEEVVALYREYWKSDYKKAREIIVKGYHDFPNDYLIMHHYMWNLGGDMADNDPEVLLEHKEEFLAICAKILDGCTEESLRLGAHNMCAKILHAEGRTTEALAIYQTNFTDWFGTRGQKTEQLFAKDTGEYYFHVRKNMYELADFAADKLGRSVFFDPTCSIKEKTERALQCGDLLLDAFEQSGEAFFLMLASSFLGRMENDLNYRGGSDEQVIAMMDKNLYAKKMLEELRGKDEPLYHAYDGYSTEAQENFLKYTLSCRARASGGRRGALLNNPDYKAVLEKYKCD